MRNATHTSSSLSRLPVPGGQAPPGIQPRKDIAGASVDKRPASDRLPSFGPAVATFEELPPPVRYGWTGPHFSDSAQPDVSSRSQRDQVGVQSRLVTDPRTRRPEFWRNFAILFAAVLVLNLVGGIVLVALGSMSGWINVALSALFAAQTVMYFRYWRRPKQDRDGGDAR